MTRGDPISLLTRWSAPRLRSVLSAVPDAILILRRSGTVVPGSRAARGLLAPRRRAAQPSGIQDILPDYDAADPPRESREMQALRPDGSRFTAEVTSSLVSGRAHDLQVFVVRDISRRKQLEAALHARQEALNRALRLAAAAEMSSAVTHELRQPIAALRNYLHACRHLAADESRHARLEETIGKALREAERADSVLRRLQDYFQAGTTRPEDLSPVPVVSETLAAQREYAERLGIELRMDLPRSLPRIRVDRTQFETVLLNLVGNAIDALVTLDPTRRKRITVSGKAEDEVVRFRIADSGPGIPQEVAGTLFEPFQTTRPEGMGLGLTISRTLVAANGGQLRLDASTDEGSVFSFTVRAIWPEQPP